MLDLWREKRALQKEGKRLRKDHDAIKDTLQAEEKMKAFSEFSRAMSANRILLEQIESRKLTLKAIDLGIKVPIDNKDLFYTEYVPIENGEQAVTVFNNEGKRQLRLQIKTESRANAEFWVKILGPTVAALTGLAGTIIGIIAILKK